MLLVLSSQHSVFSKLYIMNTFGIFCYVSYAVVSGTHSWVGRISLPGLDQKLLSRLAEYGDVIRGHTFQPCLRPPQT